MNAFLFRIWQSIVTPPYRGLPWLLFFYVAFAVFLLHDGGVFKGDMFGYDDRVRITQVLDWVNGHGFYDRLLTRVDPPEGFMTIWSRVVDMPMALVIIIAQQIVSQKTATLVAVTVVPLLETAIMLVFAGPYFARPLLGRDKARLFSLFVLFTSLFNYKYFSMSGFFVGEASHHPWYIILTVLMFGAVTRLTMGGPRRAATVMLAVSVGVLNIVGIEGYPLIAAAAAFPAVAAWESGRAGVARRLGDAFICAALLSLFLLPLHQPPEKLFTISFVEPSMMGAILVGLAALFFKIEAYVLQKLAGRQTVAAVTLVVVAGILGGGLIVMFPEILDGGAAGLSPAERWLALHDHDEAMSVWTKSRGFFDFVGLVMPTVIALVAGLYAVAHQKGRRRAVAVCHLGFAFAGGLFCEIYSRYYHHAMTTACAWLAWVWEKYKRSLPPTDTKWFYVFGSFVALGPLWMLCFPVVLENGRVGSQFLLFPAQLQTDYYACESLAASAFLNAHYSKDTMLFAPYAYSPQFLQQTDMIIDFVGNYPSHDKFIDNYMFWKTQSQEVARQIAVRRKADLVISCRVPSLYDPELTMMHQPFIVRLQMGYVPAWLKPVPIEGDHNFVLYEVDKALVYKAPPSDESDDSNE